MKLIVNMKTKIKKKKKIMRQKIDFYIKKRKEVIDL